MSPEGFARIKSLEKTLNGLLHGKIGRLETGTGKRHLEVA